MAEPLGPALERVRALLLDDATLVRAIAGGRRRGHQPRWRRAEARYVDLKAGRRLQVTRFDATQAFTANHGLHESAAVLDALLEEPFGNWHLRTTDARIQLRVTKGGEAIVHVASAPREEPERRHDRIKDRMLAEDDPVLRVLGIADETGRVKPTRQAKYRQVEEFLRDLGATLEEALAAEALRRPTPERPWQVVDLGCGNGYLTFAAHRYLTAVRAAPTRVTGVDVKQQSLDHNTEVAAELGIAEQARFLRGEIGALDDAALGERPDIVLALHACDTATDDALAQAVRWRAPVVLAAPCCHHDVAAQLRTGEAPAPYSFLVRDGILRERFADTLTDALRAAVLRLHGYRVEVVEFVESRHTPRNTLLRAIRTGASPSAEVRAELDRLADTWRVRPRLRELLG